MEDRRNQNLDNENEQNLSAGKRFGLICLAVVIAIFTVLIINL